VIVCERRERARRGMAIITAEDNSKKKKNPKKNKNKKTKKL
jgi:hypothetical protein